MEFIHECRESIQTSLPLAWLALLVAFAMLAKCADLFVGSAVHLANKLKIPKLVVGIVLVSFATTAPELSVSLMAALRNSPEMALGNAIGSVICDDGLALALAGIFATAPILINPRVFKISGGFLVIVAVLAFLFVLPDYTLNRWEGIVLVVLFCSYIALLFAQHKRGSFKADMALERSQESTQDVSVLRILMVFVISLVGIVVASEFVITSASTIAVKQFHVPKAVIALTLVAFGTSVPEVATCIAAARRGEGTIAVGNILGADIMNICWVAGASAIANDLVLDQKAIYFMFPAMLVVIAVMLVMLRSGYRLTRKKGIVLLIGYFIYLAISIVLFPQSEADGRGTEQEAIVNSAIAGSIEAVAVDPKPAANLLD